MRMSKAGGGVYGGAAVMVLLLVARDLENAFFWLHDFSSSTNMFALAIAAAAFATFGPFALSLWCWRLAGSARSGWAVHLLFIPCAYLMVSAGAWLLNHADGRAGTEEPADHALIGAFLLLSLATLVHSVALAVEIVAAIRRRADVG